jgi:formylglycine-generating enzyme required for sulfatase activity
MDELLNRYRDAAVRFVPRCEGTAPLRVAATPVTCRIAAAVLEHLRLPPETSAYRYVNVHNPRCPLRYDAERRGWQCAAGLAEHPVWCLSWAGARLVSEGLGARLPHACEWECFAANNDPGRVYPWGDGPPSGRLANYDELYGGTTEAGRFPPNEIGLFDLAGNVGEWCLDAYGGTGSLERVVKGGAWSKDARHLRIQDLRGKWARLGTTTIGLRPVWDDR